MFKKMISIMAVTGCVLAGFAYAKNSTAGFQIDCKSAVIQTNNDNIALNSGNAATSQQLYLIKNKTNTQLGIDHPHQGGTASAGWSTMLEGRHASTIAVNQANFEINCISMKNGQTKPVTCQKVIKVCVLSSDKLASIPPGTYWFVEN